ncbi:GAD-like domain-containing protein [Pseudomonas viridiflava]|nr:GAD-like domain-containing protein [Pseudomonas viridiflava]
MRRVECGLRLRFLFKKSGQTTIHQIVSHSSIKRYEDKLPKQLLQFWYDYGWCGYANGLFWTVNPQDYESTPEHWLASTGIL